MRRFLKSFWQLVVGGLCIFGGSAALYLGWYGAAHTRDVTDQVPYMISGGLLGVGLLILGGSFYFSYYVSQLHAATRRQQRALEQAVARLSAIAAVPTAALGGAAGPGPESPNGDRYLVAPGGSSFHAPGCFVVAGKAAAAVSRAEAAKRGLKPCKVCEPDAAQLEATEAPAE